MHFVRSIYRSMKFSASSNIGTSMFKTSLLLPSFSAGDAQSVPLGLGVALRWVKDTYQNIPVYITENGISDRNASLQDAHRITFYRQHLNQVLKGTT